MKKHIGLPRKMKAVDMTSFLDGSLHTCRMQQTINERQAVFPKPHVKCENTRRKWILHFGDETLTVTSGLKTAVSDTRNHAQPKMQKTDVLWIVLLDRYFSCSDEKPG